MKNLLLALTLGLASCASTPGEISVAPEGPVSRTIERVCARTEAYMASESPPMPIPEEAQGPVAASIAVARAMTGAAEVSGDMLLVTMEPIMQLHDAMVQADQELDDLERAIYLEDSARLRSLFQAASIYQAAPSL